MIRQQAQMPTSSSWVSSSRFRKAHEEKCMACLKCGLNGEKEQPLPDRCANTHRLRCSRPFTPKVHHPPISYILNTTGGVLEGDRMELHLHLAPQAEVVVVTPTATNPPCALGGGTPENGRQTRSRFRPRISPRAAASFCGCGVCSGNRYFS